MIKIDDLLFIDLETRSRVDIRKAGASRYAEDPSTDVQVACLRKHDTPVVTWVPGEPVPEIVQQHAALGGLFSAHNAGFEFAMFSRVLVPRHGWPAVMSDMRRWHCTASEAAAMALPRSLEGVAQALGLPIQKDMEGNKVMKQICRPRKVYSLQEAFRKFGESWIGEFSKSKTEPGKVADWIKKKPRKAWEAFLEIAEDIEFFQGGMWRDPIFGGLPEFTYLDGQIYQWWVDETKLRRNYQYCATDVDTAISTFSRLRRLSDQEREIWLLNERINERGLPLDMVSVNNAQIVVDKALAAANQRIKELSYNQVPTVNSLQKLTSWLDLAGVEVEALDKGAVAELCKGQLDPELREILDVRSEAGAASVKKLKAMQACVSADNRVRGSFVYHAATTGRAAGTKVQFQNVKRDTEDDIENAMDAFSFHDPELIEFLYGPAIKTVSRCLRGMIQAPPGKVFYIADYSNIEGRANAYLAGEEAKLEAFRRYDTPLLDANGQKQFDAKGELIRVGPDLYKVAAAGTYGIPVEKVTKEQRQSVGKVQELACIAEGQPVLTERGWVPIQDVILQDRVWDGVEFVSHNGVVYRGIRQVIYWDGLIATSDHVVFAEHPLGKRNLPAMDAGGEKCYSFGVMARKGAKLKRSGIGMFGYPNLDRDSRLTETLYLRPVYDILNCGPRNRFTVSGRLVHNCGFAGGAGAFSKMAKGSGVNLAAVLPSLWASAPYGRKRTAIRMWRRSPAGKCAPPSRITKDIPEARAEKAAVLAAELAKLGWRANNPMIVQFWKDLHKAAIAAVKEPRTVQTCRKIKYLCVDGFLWCALPSGRRLAYPSPKLEWVVSPWDDEEAFDAENDGDRGALVSYSTTNERFENKYEGSTVTFVLKKKKKKKQLVLTSMGTDAVTKQWRRDVLTPGILIENVVQAFCRDLLFYAALRVEAAGYPIVLHAHDELVAEVDEGFGSLEEFGNLMCELPAWAEGLPISWSGDVSTRYKK